MIPLNSNSTVPLKYQPSSGTCDKPYDNYLNGFLSKFENVTFTINTFQFFLVTLMYINVGKGKYWKILFYVSICGIVGNIIECIGVIGTCMQGKENENGIVIPFILEEFTCFFKEYSVPVLNLVKMKAYSKGKLSKVVNYIIIFLAFPFAFCRLNIGYERMTNGVLKTAKTEEFHGYAFAVMGIADMICTISIFYFVRQYNKQALVNNDINHYIKHSSYTTLIVIDVVSMVLSVLQILNSKVPNFPSNLLNPFRDVKTGFLLILAVDALLFKYNVNTTSMNQSSDTYKYGKDSVSNRSFNNKSISSYRQLGQEEKTLANGTMNGTMSGNVSGNMNNSNISTHMNNSNISTHMSVNMNSSKNSNMNSTISISKNNHSLSSIAPFDFSSSVNNYNMYEGNNIQTSKPITKNFAPKIRYNNTNSMLYETSIEVNHYKK